MPSSQPRSTTHDPFATLHDSVLRSDQDLDGLRRVAEDLRDNPHLLRDSLTTLLRNGAAVRRVAERSSVHANGFAKIVLHVGGRSSVRLHVWHRRNGRWISDMMPHGHRWLFASWIVIGTLQETTFLESDKSGIHYERRAYGRRPDGSVFLESDGQGLLQADDVTARRAGTVYARDRSVIHTATPDGDGLVASLVLQGPRLFDPTPVFLRPGVEHDHKEWPLAPVDVHELVSEVAAGIR